MPQDHPHYIFSMSTERHPDADLMSAHLNHVSHDSVNSDGREDKGGSAENPQEQQVETRLLKLPVQVLVNRLNVGDRPIPGYLSSNFASGRDEGHRIHSGAQDDRLSHVEMEVP